MNPCGPNSGMCLQAKKLWMILTDATIENTGFVSPAPYCVNDSIIWCAIGVYACHSHEVSDFDINCGGLQLR